MRRGDGICISQHISHRPLALYNTVDSSGSLSGLFILLYLCYTVFLVSDSLPSSSCNCCYWINVKLVHFCANAAQNVYGKYSTSECVRTTVAEHLSVNLLFIVVCVRECELQIAETFGADYVTGGGGHGRTE